MGSLSPWLHSPVPGWCEKPCPRSIYAMKGTCEGLYTFSSPDGHVHVTICSCQPSTVLSSLCMLRVTMCILSVTMSMQAYKGRAHSAFPFIGTHKHVYKTQHTLHTIRNTHYTLYLRRYTCTHAAHTQRCTYVRMAASIYTHASSHFNNRAGNRSLCAA